jgi:hypothetical protein
MQVVGKTIDGKNVVDGVFFMKDSEGLPLDLIIEELKSKNIVPCWVSYAKDALKAGWKIKKIKSDILNVLSIGLSDNEIAICNGNLNRMLG